MGSAGASGASSAAPPRQHAAQPGREQAVAAGALPWLVKLCVWESHGSVMGVLLATRGGIGEALLQVLEPAATDEVSGWERTEL